MATAGLGWEFGAEKVIIRYCSTTVQLGSICSTGKYSGNKVTIIGEKACMITTAGGMSKCAYFPPYLLASAIFHGIISLREHL